MGRLFILYDDEIPDNEFIHCCSCGTRVAFIRDHLAILSTNEWIIHNMFNVEVPEDKKYHRVEDGRTLADTYCIKCGDLLGGKLIAIVKPWTFIREGIFFIRWEKIGLKNQNGVANEQVPNDQQGDGSANEQVPNDQQGEGGANDEADLLAEGIDNPDLNPNL